MGLTLIRRKSPSLSIAAIAAGTGVQTVSGTLALPATAGNPVYVEFDGTLWAGAQAGVEYPVFNYTTLTGLVSNLTAAFDTGFAFTSATFRDDSTNKIIYVTFSA